MTSAHDEQHDDRLSEDQRFQDSETSTIKPLHAVLRALAEGGGSPMDSTAIIRVFFDAGSSRSFAEGQLAEIFEEAEKLGYVERIGTIGYRLTESGRNEVGPMLEMNLKYV